MDYFADYKKIFFEVPEGEELKGYYADIQIIGYYDTRYGADADNKRSETVRFIEEILIENVYDIDKYELDENEITSQMRNIIREKAIQEC